MENSSKTDDLFYESTYLSSTFKRSMERAQSLYEKALICKCMIMEYDNYTDEELYSRLETMGINSYFIPKDYYGIMEIANGKKYYGPISIKTNMDEYVTELNDDDEYEDELVGVGLVVISDNCDIDQWRRFGKGQIKKLLDEKKIVILQKYQCTPSYLNKKSPKYEEILVNSDDLFIKRDGKYHDAMLKYIRKVITKEKLHEILGNVLTLLKEEVDVMETCTKEFEEKGFQKKITFLES